MAKEGLSQEAASYLSPEVENEPAMERVERSVFR